MLPVSETMDDAVMLKYIGVISACCPSRRGRPSQPGIRMKLTLSNSIFTNPERALEGLEEFSHLWIIFHFHKNDSLHVREKQAATGMYSTKSPIRPSPLGLSLVQIDKIEGPSIFFTGGDIDLGTKVVGFQPQTSSTDHLPTVRSNVASAGKNTKYDNGNHKRIHRRGKIYKSEFENENEPNDPVMKCLWKSRHLFSDSEWEEEFGTVHPLVAKRRRKDIDGRVLQTNQPAARQQSEVVIISDSESQTSEPVETIVDNLSRELADDNSSSEGTDCPCENFSEAQSQSILIDTIDSHQNVRDSTEEDREAQASHSSKLSNDQAPSEATEINEDMTVLIENIDDDDSIACQPPSIRLEDNLDSIHFESDISEPSDNIPNGAEDTSKKSMTDLCEDVQQSCSQSILTDSCQIMKASTQDELKSLSHEKSSKHGCKISCAEVEDASKSKVIKKKLKSYSLENHSQLSLVDNFLEESRSMQDELESHIPESSENWAYTAISSSSRSTGKLVAVRKGSQCKDLPQSDLPSVPTESGVKNKSKHCEGKSQVPESSEINDPKATSPNQRAAEKSTANQRDCTSKNSLQNQSQSIASKRLQIESKSSELESQTPEFSCINTGKVTSTATETAEEELFLLPDGAMPMATEPFELEHLLEREETAIVERSGVESSTNQVLLGPSVKNEPSNVFKNFSTGNSRTSSVSLKEVRIPLVDCLGKEKFLNSVQLKSTQNKYYQTAEKLNICKKIRARKILAAEEKLRVELKNSRSKNGHQRHNLNTWRVNTCQIENNVLKACSETSSNKIKESRTPLSEEPFFKANEHRKTLRKYPLLSNGNKHSDIGEHPLMEQTKVVDNLHYTQLAFVEECSTVNTIAIILKESKASYKKDDCTFCSIVSVTDESLFPKEFEVKMLYHPLSAPVYKAEDVVEFRNLDIFRSSCGAFYGRIIQGWDVTSFDPNLISDDNCRPRAANKNWSPSVNTVQEIMKLVSWSRRKNLAESELMRQIFGEDESNEKQISGQIVANDTNSNRSSNDAKQIKSEANKSRINTPKAKQISVSIRNVNVLLVKNPLIEQIVRAKTKPSRSQERFEGRGQSFMKNYSAPLRMSKKLGAKQGKIFSRDCGDPICEKNETELPKLWKAPLVKMEVNDTVADLSLNEKKSMNKLRECRIIRHHLSKESVNARSPEIKSQINGQSSKLTESNFLVLHHVPSTKFKEQTSHLLANLLEVNHLGLVVPSDSNDSDTMAYGPISCETFGEERSNSTSPCLNVSGVSDTRNPNGTEPNLQSIYQDLLNAQQSCSVLKLRTKAMPESLSK